MCVDGQSFRSGDVLARYGVRDANSVGLVVDTLARGSTNVADIVQSGYGINITAPEDSSVSNGDLGLRVAALPFDVGVGHAGLVVRTTRLHATFEADIGMRGGKIGVCFAVVGGRILLGKSS